MCSANRTGRSGKHLPDRVERIAQCVEHLHGYGRANCRHQPSGCTRWRMHDMRRTSCGAAGDHHSPIKPGVVGSPLTHIGHQDITREGQPFVHQRLLALVEGARRKGEQDLSGVPGHCAGVVRDRSLQAGCVRPGRRPARTAPGARRASHPGGHVPDNGRPHLGTRYQAAMRATPAPARGSQTHHIEHSRAITARPVNHRRGNSSRAARER